jgi:hypothetical protein
VQTGPVPLADRHHVEPHRFDDVVQFLAFGFRDHRAQGGLDDLDQALERRCQPLALSCPLRHLLASESGTLSAHAFRSCGRARAPFRWLLPSSAHYARRLPAQPLWIETGGGYRTRLFRTKKRPSKSIGMPSSLVSVAGTRHQRSGPEFIASPRLDPSQAERSPGAVCLSLVVELPFESATLARAVGCSHCPAVGADPNRRQPEADSQKGD